MSIYGTLYVSGLQMRNSRKSIGSSYQYPISILNRNYKGRRKGVIVVKSNYKKSSRREEKERATTRRFSAEPVSWKRKKNWEIYCNFM